MMTTKIETMEILIQMMDEVAVELLKMDMNESMRVMIQMISAT